MEVGYWKSSGQALMRRAASEARAFDGKWCVGGESSPDEG